jgi:hypothetical protein
MKKQLSQSIYDKFLDAVPARPAHEPPADFETIRTMGLPWLALDIPVPVQSILHEIHSIQHMMVCHRESLDESWGWHSFVIHGKAWDATREDEHYDDARPHAWTDRAVELMPNTVNYFQTQWPAHSYARIRVMLLEPGGFINVHKDSQQTGLGPINIAITQPNDCNFVMAGHGCVPFSVGQAMWLDVSNPHVVRNNSDQNRFHIIIHQEFDQQFEKVVEKSYNLMYNNTHENLSLR